MIEIPINRILLIDDSDIDRFVHQKMIGHYNISNHLDSVSSGKAALNFLRENASDADALPDLILLDVYMPEMDGFEFLVGFERLLDTLVKKPIIFMLSSTEDEHDKLRIERSVHVTKLLKKPFSPRNCIRALEQI